MGVLVSELAFRRLCHSLALASRSRWSIIELRVASDITLRAEIGNAGFEHAASNVEHRGRDRSSEGHE